MICEAQAFDCGLSGLRYTSDCNPLEEQRLSDESSRTIINCSNEAYAGHTSQLSYMNIYTENGNHLAFMSSTMSSQECYRSLSQARCFPFLLKELQPNAYSNGCFHVYQMIPNLPSLLLSIERVAEQSAVRMTIAFQLIDCLDHFIIQKSLAITLSKAFKSIWAANGRPMDG